MAVAGYNIYIDGVKKNTSLVTELTYNLTGLATGTSQNVEVKAVDDHGQESASDATQIKTFLTKPGTVTGVTATGITTTRIDTACTDVTGAASYKIERSTDNITFTSLVIGHASTTYSDTTVTEGTTYYYRWKATNATGDSLNWSTVASATPAADTAAPTFSNVSVSSVGSNTATFNAQLSEAGTIYWAVYPTADAQHSTADILAGTGATDFGSKATAGGVIEAMAIDTLIASTAYKVHYFGEDSAGNDSAAAMTAEFTTAAANAAPTVAAPIADRSKDPSYGFFTVDLTGVFADADGDPLTYTATSSNTALATVSVSGATLTVTNVSGTGTATITVTASDGKGGTAQDAFVLTVATNSGILLSSDFSGTTIDTTKHTEVDPVDEVYITQENRLQFYASGVTAVTAVDANHVIGANTYTDAFISMATRIQLTGNNGTQFYLMLRKDADNYALITRDMVTAGAYGRARLLIRAAGATVYDFKSDVSIDAKRWRIKRDATNKISFEYYNATTSAWTEIDAATTKTHDIGTGLTHYMAMGGASGIATTLDFYELRITNYDYTTQLP